MALEREYTFRNTSLPQSCYKSFMYMRNQNKFCDIELNIGTQRISAHRVILAAGMPLFCETLSNNDEIAIPNIEPVAFELLIDYVYSYELKINMDNVKNLLSGSCALQMNDVQDACCDFLSRRLQPQDVLSFIDLANDFNLPKLKECVELYAKENFQEVSGTEEFLNCPFEYVRELIAKDDLNVVSEQNVLDSVLRWVKASLGDRTNQLPELLTQVRMVLLEPLYLTELVEKEDLIRKSYICRDLVDEARNYTLLAERRKQSCSFVTKPRKFINISEGIQKTDIKLHCFRAKVKYDVLQFDLIKETAQTKGTKEYLINTGCTTEFNKKMYFFHDGYLLEYDPEGNGFHLQHSCTVPRICVAAVSLGTNIFLCGGCTSGFMASNAVECFEPKNNKVKQVDALHTARWTLCAVALGNHIYTLGGRDKHNVYDTVERYSFSLGKWQNMSNMLTPRYDAGASVLNGKIYICGGHGGFSVNRCVKTAEMYDSVTNKWSFISSMNTMRAELTLVVFSGKLYAIGGSDNKGKYLKSSDVYDVQSDKWNCGPNFDGFDASGIIML